MRAKTFFSVCAGLFLLVGAAPPIPVKVDVTGGRADVGCSWSAPLPIPPCAQVKVDVTGWRTERFGERLVFGLPPTFKRDSTELRYRHGGRRWTDGARWLEQVNGFWGEGSFEKDSTYSECVCTQAGIRFRVITGYRTRDSTYYALAVNDTAYTHGRSMTMFLGGESPDSADLRLFLAIFRTVN